MQSHAAMKPGRHRQRKAECWTPGDFIGYLFPEHERNDENEAEPFANSDGSPCWGETPGSELL